MLRPGRFTTGNDPAPIVCGAGWALGPVWMGEENTHPTVIWSMDRPVRSTSLYWPNYPSALRLQQSVENATYNFIQVHLHF